MSVKIIILAAGKGTRMKGGIPKVAVPIAGLPMLTHVINTAQSLSPTEITIVTSPHKNAINSLITEIAKGHDIRFQDKPLGTGHALAAGLGMTLDENDEWIKPPSSPSSGVVLVLYGDTPLLKSQDLQQMVDEVEKGAMICVAGFKTDRPTGYGRLILDENGMIERIVEERDCDAIARNINLCNGGVMAFQAAPLVDLLMGISNQNDKQEYYLTDAIALAGLWGGEVKLSLQDEGNLMGVDTLHARAIAEELWQNQKRHEMIDKGVVMNAPQTVYFSHDTDIEEGVIIEPHIIFGQGVKVKSGAMIKGFSHLEGCIIEEGAQIGPYARIRPNSIIAKAAKVGNFVELKNTQLHEGAKANHLSYIGDSTVGKNANIGAGTITCNYDGVLKHKTDIGEDCFIGSNSSLVAPLSLGKGSMVGAGSVIVKNIDADDLAVSRAVQKNISGLAKKLKTQKQKAKDS